MTDLNMIRRGVHNKHTFLGTFQNVCEKRRPITTLKSFIIMTDGLNVNIVEINGPVSGIYKYRFFRVNLIRK